MSSFQSGSPSTPSGRPASFPPVGAQPDRPTVAVATYGEYPQAQRAVDFLSDEGFPVEHAAIVGTDLRMVEKVLGRMTTGRAAMAGLASGAWFGLFVGLLIGIFAAANWFAVVLVGLVVGAVWGAVFGALAHAATRGRRDFSSVTSLQAGQYAVVVTTEHAEAARGLLVRLNWRSAEQ